MRSVLLAMLMVATGACASTESASTATPESSSTEAEGPAAEPEPPTRITCGTQYRPVAGSGDDEEEGSVSVERPVADTRTDEESVTFPELDLAITYLDDGQETPSLLVRVSSPQGQEVERVLYQFGSQALPQFAGGDSFTGLHYVYSGQAELQWWCSAQA